MNDALPIGDRIRARRAQAGWSLEELGRRSGVSRAMLSEVERGRKNPTVRLAWQVARALGLTLTELFEADPKDEVQVLRAAERAWLKDPATGVTRAGMTSSLFDRKLELAWYELPPGATTGPMVPNRPGVREQASVLRGTLRLRLGGRTFELGPGDSLSYRAGAVEYLSGGEGCAFLLLSDSSRALP